MQIMSLGERLAPILKELASTILEFSEHKPEYFEQTMFDAAIVFQSVLMDQMYNYNKSLPLDQHLEIAELTGKELRKLVLKVTGLDLHKLAKNE